MNDYDELIEAMDDYRNKRDAWVEDRGRPGFYDPCDTHKEHREKDISDALGRLDKVFRRLVIDVVDTRGGWQNL